MDSPNVAAVDMDESAAIKLLSDKDFKARLDSCTRVEVRGYDPSLSWRKLDGFLRNEFSSCGKVVHVVALHSCSLVYIRGEDAVDKARGLRKKFKSGEFKLSLAIAPPPRFIKPSPAMLARMELAGRKLSSEMIGVRGHDHSLPLPEGDDTKTALADHFSSCGDIVYVDFDFVTPSKHPGPDLPFPVAKKSYFTLWISGEGAREKALQLDGSVMSGCKLDVWACRKKSPTVPEDGPVRTTIPARFLNPTRMAKAIKLRSTRRVFDPPIYPSPDRVNHVDTEALKPPVVCTNTLPAPSTNPECKQKKKANRGWRKKRAMRRGCNHGA